MRSGRENGGAQATTGQAFAPEAPSISLPKGGGAIRGIGEKYAANPVTGTGSLTIPIATSPGRSGFGPSLALSYDSGLGNGAFGFGWTLPLPQITRKTDRGLPRYDDATESDVYVLSGAEDLVPVLQPNGSRFEDDTTAPGFTIHRYRPRIEGLFARIERWTNRTTGEIHWRSISPDNVTSLFGHTPESRIADPEDGKRIFSWLLCASYDDRGNAIAYRFTAENDAGIDPTLASERNRSRPANRYLKNVRYGNLKPNRDADGRATDPLQIPESGWMFEVVFDYSEGHYEELALDPALPAAEQHRSVLACAAAGGRWAARPDPFSSYRSGFEVRTYRRCRRVLMFHRFAELGSEPTLVRSTEFDYADLDYEQSPTVETELGHAGSTRFASFLRAVSQCGFVRDETRQIVELDGARYVTYLTRSHPPVEFTYSQARIQSDIREIDADSLENLPVGLDGGEYQWVDLDGEGISGILTAQANAWFYKPNLGDGRFAPQQLVARLPSTANVNEGKQLLDLSGDGQLDVVMFGGPLPGFHERTHDESWEGFRTFTTLPNIEWDDPNLRFVDLNGDGHADALLTEHDVLTWFPSLGEDGFGPARQVRQSTDEEKGPRLLMADGAASIYLSDMSGDGLSDLVRISNGEVCYWPNLGYGRFGARVSMDNAPWFDHADQFNLRHLRLADIDGSGVTDIVYLGRDGVRIYFNQSGNRWSEPQKLPSFPPTDDLSAVTTADLLGNGTSCLVWSSPLPGDTRRPLRYIDLMGGQKPHLLVRTKNNLGAETTVQYAPSTRFYLRDKEAGKPWTTRLPFPVHCVEKVTVTDHWRKTSFSTTYSYHHGYFDGQEREFRGFGRVEQVDVESYGTFSRGSARSPYITDDLNLYQPPVKTVTWYHTGAFVDRKRTLSAFEDEYFPNWLDPTQQEILGGFQENILPEPDLASEDLDVYEWREALRACKGLMLRQEVYELDVDALEQGEQRPVKLFSTAYHNCHIRRLQPRANNRHGVFLVVESEAITYHYELDLRTDELHPDPRVAHMLNLQFDLYGHVLQSVAITYPRFGQYEDESLSPASLALIRRVQQEIHLAYTESRYTDDVAEQNDHRLRVPCEVQTYELTGIRPEDADDVATPDARDNRYFTVDELRRFRLSMVHQPDGELVPVPEIPYHQLPRGDTPEKRLVGHLRTLFFDDGEPVLAEPLPFGELGRLGLVYENYRLSLTEDLLGAVFEAKITPPVRDGLSNARFSGYLTGPALAVRFSSLDTAGQYWKRSGIAGFAQNASEHFYLPERYTDAFGNVISIEHDARGLFVRSSMDPLGNMIDVIGFDFRVLSPSEIKDFNDNLSEIVFDILGFPAAVAVRGKGDEGDRLEEFDFVLTNPNPAELTALFDSPEFDEAAVRRLVGAATARYVYSFGETCRPDGSVAWGIHPASACTILRETHVSRLAPEEQSPLQAAFSYSDGTGSVLVSKVQSEPEAPGRPLRWVASGKSILNNKGNPVLQYEPYFSPPASGYRFEEPHEVGVTPVLFYDAIGRVVRTELPDGSYSRADFSPWHDTTHDPNDTVTEEGNIWFARKMAASAAEQRAAEMAAEHAGTPGCAILDSLGRVVVTIAHNRVRSRTGEMKDEKHLTFTRLDAEGKSLWVRDARGNLVMQCITSPVPSDQAADPAAGFVPCYDTTGNLLFQHSMDTGDRWMLSDAAGEPLFAWDERGHMHRIEYDALHRPVRSFVTGADPLDPNREIVFGLTIFGDTPGNGLSDGQKKQLNLRGKPYKVHDTAGLVSNFGRNPATGENEAFDFKGNLLRSTRRLAADYKTTPDWSQDPTLETEVFSSSTLYDALSRPIQLLASHSDNPGATCNVIRPGYNAGRLLEHVEVWLEHAIEPSALLNSATASQQIIRNIDYDAKGQRTLIQYGNGAETRYVYDTETFRLVHLYTRRGAAFTSDCGDEPPPPRTAAPSDPPPDIPCGLQNLHYAFDPVGNLIQILDAAQDRVFHSNACITPGAEYRYDAMYRLVAAAGREHEGGDGQPDSNDHQRRTTLPNDCRNLRNYVETYRFDAVGNLLQMRHHQGRDVDRPGAVIWNRRYQYALDSNRLLATRLPADADDLPDYAAVPGYSARYEHDAHGNMIRMPHLPLMGWDFKDQLRATQQQIVNGGAGEKTYYVYDGAGQRVRKVTETQNGARKNERIYLAGLELYRRYSGNSLTLERETMHVMDDTRRIALIETRTRLLGSDPAPRQLVRYQLSNHIGSSTLELDDQAQVITYEEYHSYGSTAYQAARSQTETPNRYRYAGKERDEESGFSYHGARFCAPWLGRWTSFDPAGSMNGFAYCAGNPVTLRDPDGREEHPPEMYQAQVTGKESQEQVRQMFAARGIFFKGNATWMQNEGGGYWHLQTWQVIARETGTKLNLRADQIKAPSPATKPPSTAPSNAQKVKEIRERRQQDWEAAQSGMWDTVVDMAAGAIGTSVPDPLSRELIKSGADALKSKPPAPTGDYKRDMELRENYEQGGFVMDVAVVAVTLCPTGEIVSGARLAAGKAPSVELYGAGAFGAGDLKVITFSEEWAAGAKTVTTAEGALLESEELAGLSAREAQHGRSVGQIQGRENRIDALTLNEFDPNQPAHIRGWLRNERRAVEFGNIKEPRNPRGYVQGHGPQTPAREGFDYYNSSLTTEEINATQEEVSRRLRR